MWKTLMQMPQASCRITTIMPNDTTSEDQNARRAFLQAAGRKAAYVAPIVTVLAASNKAFGSNAFFSFCGDQGSPCVTDADCCTGLTCQESGQSGVFKCKP
jgi:formiminotetrahydrofolate cyclodeaminase